ncbi:cellulose binding domain-containing protein [Streptomyces sp. NBC_01198]|uniref:cellulose binding domain-containing protein n=1 Tax=Streptomyces sp. NBC_01198 TaxID=2903769 RepID=UPI002E106958|nr:cellulose-binding domain-containing protein [Streptomyces sp. NBC_01198]
MACTRNEWTGGFTADVVVGNNGAGAVNGFSFPGDQKVTSAWNGAVTQSGNTVKATNLSYNSTIAPGGPVDGPPGPVRRVGDAGHKSARARSRPGTGVQPAVQAVPLRVKPEGGL